ncbi:YheC/YheD family protein [Paenibacillus turpanensis]|uniref:YheC/YheD family protein n=1 Tax=Paenibacillus turpanensis TaxID=2689078 RepID=UPI00140E3403|nr:YheC/YheD family protein [Paenibacillus turpanensis]
MPYNRSKYTKYRLLKRSAKISRYLPKTLRMSKKHFRSMLSKYKKVIVKPSVGSKGSGVMSVSSLKGGRYKVQYGKKKKTVSSRQAAYSYIRNKSKNRSLIVQKKIRLAKVKGRPFDVRIMIQRKENRSWVVTGKLAKVAGSGYIITNVNRSGGKVLPLTRAIRSSNIKHKSKTKIKRKLNTLAVRTAVHLSKYYDIRIIGLDVGLDRRGKPWIIEANFKPAKSMFLKLKDKSMYRRIMAFHRKDHPLSDWNL